MTTDQVITLRLEDIERTLAVRSIRAIADQASRRIIAFPEHALDPAEAQDQWPRITIAPIIEVTDEELLSDRYIEIAVSRATELLCTSK